MYIMFKFEVKRRDGIFDVLLMRHKDTKEWSFINMTKEHICPCRFKTVKDAIIDLEDYLSSGRILSYKIKINELNGNR